MPAPTWQRTCRGHGPYSLELWVHAELIDHLLAAGWGAEEIRYEMRLTPSDIADVVVEVPDRVLVFECKLDGYPKPGAIRQVIRYVRRAVAIWPDRDVYGFLVWTDRSGDTFPNLRLLEVA